MFQRMTVLAALAAGVLGLASNAGVAQPDKKAKPEDQAKAKKALQDVQDFIGLWNLEGTQKAGGKTEAWKEKVSWSWKFKDGNPSITVAFAEGKGKFYKEGELNYDVAGKKYVLTLTPAGKDDTKQVFDGTFAKGALTVSRKDAKTGDVYRIKMNTVADGVRFALKYEKQDGGKGLFSDVYALNGNKDGESLAGGSKKPECIVSGGAANIPVTYNGKTYYVCCSGCRDEFNANPKKYAK
ncbi:MAG: YHS domain-containing protein [Planctomycetes bacterium]|nr:YHS domain-containing protein [Planctomycetota bacterium]